MRRLARLNIRAVDHLCRHLRTSPRELRAICANIESFYRHRERRVKGKMRTFDIPVRRLREILDNLQSLLQRMELPDHIQGGRRGFSHVSNAARHVRKPLVLKADVKDFFPSIGHRRVYEMFRDRLGCSPDVARSLSRVTTFRGRVPQGSPTSTILAALVAEPLSSRLAGLAKQHRSDFSQHVDDVTLSGPAHLRQLQRLVERIIHQEGYVPKSEKTAAVPQSEEQVVTGVRVNSGVDVPRDKLCGIQRALAELVERRRAGRHPSGREIQSIEGKIGSVLQLNPGAGKALRRRLRRLLQIVSASPKETAALTP